MTDIVVRALRKQITDCTLLYDAICADGLSLDALLKDHKFVDIAFAAMEPYDEPDDDIIGRSDCYVVWKSLYESIKIRPSCLSAVPRQDTRTPIPQPSTTTTSESPASEVLR